MLLIFFIFFVKIEFFLCIIFENKNEQDLFDEIKREQNNLQIHLTLQLAAEKRCNNRKQLIESYQRMLINIYRNDDWPKQEQLNKIFSDVNEIIYLNGLDIQNDIFSNSFLIPNINRRNFLYIGIAQYDHKNFSARCILYGSLKNSLLNHNRLVRLLYILIGCGIFLLILIICSIIHDRRQEIVDNQNKILSNKSITVLVDKDPRISSRKNEINRMTMTRLGSTIDERSSAVHNFFQSPK